jgi:hypothetical protein
VWTFVYDASGLSSVTLKWRVDADGVNPLGSIQNETYAGGPEVGAWNSASMSATQLPAPQNGVLPATYRAARYGAMVTGQTNVLIDYYVEALDGQGHVQKSPIQHVWVGDASTPPGGDVLAIDPNPAVAGQNVTTTYNPGGRPLAGAAQVYLHYGFNHWTPVVSPDPAMTWNATLSRWQITVMVQSSATLLDMVFNNGAGTWDNNNGADWHFNVTGGIPPQQQWVMDGQRDAGAALVAQNGTLQLYAGLIGSTLYVAAPDAGEGNDHFIFVAGTPGALRAAPWAKAGQVAGWSAYLGNENDNSWSGWSDTTATVQSATGGGSGWLEGTIDLAQELGALPSVIYLAFAPYANPNGGALVSIAQVPASVNADGNVDAVEYAAFQLRRVGDLNCDGTVGFGDINPFVLALSNPSGYAQSYPNCPVANRDINGDGSFNFGDINPFVAVLSGGR